MVFRRVIGEKLFFKSGYGDSAWFREGITLELHCKQDSGEDIEIISPTEIIVQESKLVHGMTQRYDFQNNSSASVLIIKRLSREDQGIYTCQEELRTILFVQVHVLYSPSDKSPQCTCTYDSPVIFHDIRQDYINFSCTTEEGNPPVLMALTVHESENFQNITDFAKLCIVDQSFDNIRTLSCHINESLGNTTFLCDVIQQFPSPYSGSYQNSCSFGPLHFLSNFSVTINEADITVEEEQGVNLTCTTNVAGVEIKWIDIPVDWESHVTTSDYFSRVSIKRVKQQSTSKITVQCIGTYGNRNVTDSIKITIEGKTNVIVIFLLVISVVIGVTFLIGLYAWKHGTFCLLRNYLASDHNTPQNAGENTIDMEATALTPHKNNANNIAIKVCDGD
ncbi:hypothetical protein HOLleu_40399 [Holothuria leucospilota]|uniref:Ig-like domain-containing protein n=1 Tax=Holothuria leucospilota TaxID=206669 RepID=A0A9Q0YG16_HOLLE|nr:hypothetical protein HOLleu_40399 [Holothuria leucospilota]